MRTSTTQTVGNLPCTLPGFDHISRHWDRVHDTSVAKILPGEYYVTVQDEMIATVLGSCIAACIRDPVFGIGGMNHFMLPASKSDETESRGSGDQSHIARYGNHAMELLINAILKHGGKRDHLEIKVFGGGRIMPQMMDIGQRNTAFVRDYIRTEGLNLLAEEVGSTYPRKVLYFPASGKVRMKKLRSLHTNTIAQKESQYLDSLQQPVVSNIELF